MYSRMRCELATILLISGIGFALPAKDADEIYGPGPDVSPPKVIHKVDPYYTAQAWRAQIQATAVLEVVVDEHGKPQKSTVISPIGFGLDERAREAVSAWVF